MNIIPQQISQNESNFIHQFIIIVEKGRELRTMH